MAVGEAIAQVVATPPSWLLPPAGPPPVALFTRVRLSRNLAELPFPGKATVEQRLAAISAVRRALAAAPAPGPALALPQGQFTPTELEVLVERRLLSPVTQTDIPERALWLGAQENWAVLANDEDHVVVQTMLPGLDLAPAWQQASALEKSLGRHLEFAYAADLGYLTASVGRLGTGLRAGVTLHLTGLAMAGQLTGVVQAVRRLGCEARGWLGDGAEAPGDLVEIVNQGTLGESETRLLDRLAGVVREIISHEEDARRLLLERGADRMRDRVARAFGTLCHARLMGTKEALAHLTGLRLGLALGWRCGISSPVLHNLLLAVQPGHLQAKAGTALDGPGRSAGRATVLRQIVTRSGAPPPDGE